MADLTVTAANVTLVSGSFESGIAGVTITAGQALYKDATDNSELKLAQCDGTAAEAAAVGIALHGSLNNQPVAYAKNGAQINIGATTAKTTTYFVSGTPGGVAPQADIVTTGWHLVELGYATNTTGTFVVQILNRGVTV